MVSQQINLSIKTIKSKQYLYSWRYLSKAERNRSSQRFKWTYHGRYHSSKAQAILSRISIDQRQLIENEYEAKKLKEAMVLKKVKELLNIQPYNNALKRINSINNAENRRIKRSELLRQMRSIARRELRN